MAQLVKNPPAMWGTCVQSMGWEDPLEKGKDSTPVLACRIPWTIVHEVAKSQTQVSDFHFHSAKKLNKVPYPILTVVS